MINWQLSKQGICWPVSLTVSRAQVSTHRVQVCFWSYRCQVTSFQMIAGSSLIISIHMKYVVFMCRTIKIFISNWPRTRKCSQLLHAGKTVAFNFAHHGHAVRPIFMLWLVNIWQVSSCGKFTQHLVYSDSWSWQRFVSTFDVLNCIFSLDVQNEIQLLSGIFFYSRLVCLLGFWLRNRSLVKVGNRISDGIVFVFQLAWCVRGLKRLKRFWPYLIPFRSCMSNGKPE